MASITNALRTVALAALVAATATAAQAADSERITPPNPNDVAILRGLLALQHPALRQAAAPVIPGAAAPAALTTEPSQQQGAATPATEGEACVSPDTGRATCGSQAETSIRGFRASLERSLAAAGFDTRRL